MEAAKTLKVTVRERAQNTIAKIADYAADHPVAWQIICWAIGAATALLAAVLAKYFGTIGTIIGGVIRLIAPEIMGIF